MRYNCCFWCFWILSVLVGCYKFTHITKLLNSIKNRRIVSADALGSTEDAERSSISLGFSRTLDKGFYAPTHTILGSNALEHGINLVEEALAAKIKNHGKILVVCGWNSARVDALMWELEPRGFSIESITVSDEPMVENVLEIFELAYTTQTDAIVAMGGAAVMDAAKAAFALLYPVVDDNDVVEPSITGLINSLNSTMYKSHVTSRETSSISSFPIQLIMIPYAPILGAELSTTSAILPVSNHFSSANSFRFKQYIRISSPTMCIYQPESLSKCSMELLHLNIISLLALTIDRLLSTSNSLSEYIMWIAIEKLVPILDKTVNSAFNRSLSRMIDPAAFEQYTVNDVEGGHVSQYFRRYGQDLPSTLLDELSQVAMSLGTCAASYTKPTPLQFLVDTISATSGVESHYVARLSFIAADYLLAVLDWSEDKQTEVASETEDCLPAVVLEPDRDSCQREERKRESGVEWEKETSREERRNRLRAAWRGADSSSKNTDTNSKEESHNYYTAELKTNSDDEEQQKSFVRNKLSRLSILLSRSSILTPTVLSTESTSDNLRNQLQNLKSLFDSITGPANTDHIYSSPSLPAMKSAEDCKVVLHHMRKVCGDVPGCMMTEEQVFVIFNYFNALSEKCANDILENNSTDNSPSSSLGDDRLSNEESNQNISDTVTQDSMIKVGDNV